MKTINEIKSELLVQYPILTKGINEKIVKLTIEEYDETINEWAKNLFETQNSKPVIG